MTTLFLIRCINWSIGFDDAVSYLFSFSVVHTFKVLPLATSLSQCPLSDRNVSFLFTHFRLFGLGINFNHLGWTSPIYTYIYLWLNEPFKNITERALGIFRRTKTRSHRQVPASTTTAIQLRFSFFSYFVFHIYFVVHSILTSRNFLYRCSLITLLFIFLVYFIISFY